MRLVTPGDAAPAAVSKYLLPYERQVIVVRKHPAVLIRPVSYGAAGVVADGLLTWLTGVHGGFALFVILAAWMMVLVYLAWQVFAWYDHYFAVTSQRMVLTSGVVTQKVAMMPLVKVTDMSFQRNFWGRLFGYGTFILESAGQEQALRVIDHLPYPEQLYLEVCGLIFPGTGNNSDD